MSFQDSDGAVTSKYDKDGDDAISNATLALKSKLGFSRNENNRTGSPCLGICQADQQSNNLGDAKDHHNLILLSGHDSVTTSHITGLSTTSRLAYRDKLTKAASLLRSPALE